MRYVGHREHASLSQTSNFDPPRRLLATNMFALWSLQSRTAGSHHIGLNESPPTATEEVCTGSHQPDDGAVQQFLELRVNIPPSREVIGCGTAFEIVSAVDQEWDSVLPGHGDVLNLQIRAFHCAAYPY